MQLPDLNISVVYLHKQTIDRQKKITGYIHAYSIIPLTVSQSNIQDIGRRETHIAANGERPDKCDDDVLRAN